MKTIYMSDEEIEKYPLFTNFKSTEAEIRDYNNQELLKIFYNYNHNKIHTLELIEMHEKELKLIKELLIFKKYIDDYSHIIGIVIDKGYQENFQDYSENCSYQDLISVLKSVGFTLEKLHKLRNKEHLLTNFFIGDLHEKNILVDKDTKNIQFIDLDSCKIGDNRASLAKYLQFHSTRPYVKNYLNNKYPFDVYHFSNNENTDIFCYMAMIAKNLLGFSITILSIEEYYRKIYELKKAGLPQPICQAFLALYNNIENINPYLYLEDIPTSFEKNLKPML